MSEPLLSSLRRRITKTKPKGRSRATPRESISSMSEVSSGCSSDHESSLGEVVNSPPPSPPQYNYNHRFNLKAAPNAPPPSPPLPPLPTELGQPEQPVPAWRTQMLDLVSSYYPLTNTAPNDFAATTTAKAHHQAVLTRLGDAETSERAALAVLRAYLDHIHASSRGGR